MDNPHQERGLKIFDIALDCILGYPGAFRKSFERYFVRRIESQRCEEIVEFRHVLHAVQSRQVTEQNLVDYVALNEATGSLLDFLREGYLGITAEVKVVQKLFVQALHVAGGDTPDEATR